MRQGWIWTIIMALLLSGTAGLFTSVAAEMGPFSQKDTAATKEKKASAPAYVCMHCQVGSDKAGKCPTCKMNMEKAKPYACPKCHVMSDKGGKCKCGADMVKMSDAAKKCSKCGYYYAKDKKACPVCAMKAKAQKK